MNAIPAVASDVPEQRSEEPGDASRGRLDRARALAVRFGPAVWCYALLKLIGFTIFMKLLSFAGDYARKPARFGGGANPWDVPASWDGWWYQQVAQFGYHPALVPIAGPEGFNIEQNSAAFFPLYPGLMRLTSDVTGLGLYGAGMLVSVVASLFAAAGIYAVVEKLSGDVRAGVIAAGIWAIAPGSGAEWAVYSDSTFVALAAWACYCVMTRQWVAAGVITLVAGLNRPTAAALIGAVGLAALVELYRRESGVLRPLAAILLAPIGLLGYVGWVGWKTGEWGGYFRLQHDAWLHYFDWGQGTWHAIRGVLLGRSDYPFAFPVPDLLATLIVFTLPVLIVLLVRLRPPLVLTAYTLATIVSVLGSLGIFGNVSRYLLPAFPLFIALAIGMRKLSWPVLAAVLGTGAVASGWYAGYVIFELGVP
ncbi:glycosyltransferase family 39 protein [Streptomyces sp. 1331.2]|uniref:glycosyltransferase family 39 protein n=1 Tax=Streptomyces sp. 1331.2 TaxID=1938835 RepID=UPI000BDBF44A|nr:glycosyltransferase family 39 protein [Streptomyces sp. 1331.2]SOB82882.1 Dolichyl-phosphate-mannose-protein mannosyltransferase [Streptomyces sp. 1331.2]